MFGFFFRYLNYPMESKWTVAKSMRNGMPCLIRFNQFAISLVGHTDYRFRVGVFISFKELNLNRFPSDIENGQLNEIEIQLSDVLEQHQESLYVLSVTTQTMGEFVFYSRLPSSAISSI